MNARMANRLIIVSVIALVVSLLLGCGDFHAVSIYNQMPSNSVPKALGTDVVSNAISGAQTIAPSVFTAIGKPEWGAVATAVLGLIGAWWAHKYNQTRGVRSFSRWRILSWWTKLKRR